MMSRRNFHSAMKGICGGVFAIIALIAFVDSAYGGGGFDEAVHVRSVQCATPSGEKQSYCSRREGPWNSHAERP